jgi:hypothetical protein
MGLYQLYYRAGDAFAGVIFVEANSLGNAPWRADRTGLDPGGECHCIELHSDDADGIPRSFIGRLLDQDEVSELERIMVACIPKKAPAPSVRRFAARPRRRA